MRYCNNIFSLLGYLPFIAMIFVVAYAYQQDRSIPENIVPNIWLLLSSSLLLIIAYIYQTIIWYYMLRTSGLDINIKTAFISRFKTVLTKYIPGKIWSVVSVSGEIHKESGSFIKILFLTSWFQFIQITSAIILTVIGVAIYGWFFTQQDSWHYMWLIIILMSVVSIINNKKIINWVSKLIEKRLNIQCDIVLPSFAFMVFSSLVFWLFLGVAYTVFFLSIGFEIGLLPIFFQASAHTSGMLAAIVPGGIGVREAVMTGYLLHASLPLSQALLLSISARIWSLIIELILFVIGLVIEFQKKKEAV